MVMTKYAENYSETEENFGKKILCCCKYKREVTSSCNKCTTHNKCLKTNSHHPSKFLVRANQNSQLVAAH